jgi:hypothetical protein
LNVVGALDFRFAQARFDRNVRCASHPDNALELIH